MTEKTTDVSTQDDKPKPGARGTNGFQAIREELDRMFHAFSLPEVDWRPGGWTRGDSLGLRIDVSETDGEIQITGELPGVDEKDVAVSLEDDVLRIRAEKRSEKEDADKTWRLVERSYGTLERAVRVPSGIDPASIKAKFAKGILTVTLPKPPQAKAQAKKIEITAG